MHLKNYDLNKLPFPELLKTYTTRYDDLADFYQVNPFKTESIANFANAFSFSGDRLKTVKLLREFNNQFDIDDAARKNIDRLGENDALCIVTGQQLGLLGGPLFTMFKTIATIHLSNQLEQRLNRPVIPIFWLADEDHDYDEINVVKVLNDDEELTSFSLSPKDDRLPPVSDLELQNGINELLAELKESLRETDFTEDFWALLERCYQPGVSFRKAFGNLIAVCFSKHGLVLAGSNHAAIKQQLKQLMITAVKQADEIREALQNQSDKLARRFHQQATIYDSHLFFLDGEYGRTKIHRENGHWTTETGREWSEEELVETIESKPEKFSPDVFLRPILQDALLPTLGYVGGPGEIGYYGQMKTFYHCFDQQMPAIFPRLSATFIDPAIDRIMGELPFSIHEYNNRIEDLESEFIENSSQVDIEALFDEWKQEAESVAASYQQKIVGIDETLERTAERAQAKYFNELNRLKGKAFNALKKKEEIQLNRIRRIKEHIFPERTLQERTLSAAYFMNKYGLDIWERLLEELPDDESFALHKLIYM